MLEEYFKIIKSDPTHQQSLNIAIFDELQYLETTYCLQLSDRSHC